MHLSLLHTHTSPGYRWGRIKRYRKWWNPGGTEALPHLGSVCGLSPAVKQQSTTTLAFLPSQWEACSFSRNLTRNLICRKSLHPKPRCSSGGSWFHLIRCEDIRAPSYLAYDNGLKGEWGFLATLWDVTWEPPKLYTWLVPWLVHQECLLRVHTCTWICLTNWGCLREVHSYTLRHGCVSFSDVMLKTYI